MSLNLGYGRPSWSTLSGSYILSVRSTFRNSILGTYSISQIASPTLIIHLSFQQIAPFGRGTIRRFIHNVADLKKLAARDFEDILQVICFIGDFM
jgi:hypothetical protein